jgi:uncharacterized protein (TIGR02594 family)
MMNRVLNGAAILALCISTSNAKPLHHHHHKTTRNQIVMNSGCVFDNDGHQTCGGSINRTGNEYNRSGYNSIVAEARRYLGTNPTGRRRLWCGAFMDMVLRNTGHRGAGNLASNYAHLGTRVSGPQIGAIAVMSRRGGGHVGVVSGIDANGNPIIISGNHNHTTAEAVYPARRIYAYVIP